MVQRQPLLDDDPFAAGPEPAQPNTFDISGGPPNLPPLGGPGDPPSRDVFEDPFFGPGPLEIDPFMDPGQTQEPPTEEPPS